MNVLLTGAFGNVGGHTLANLVEQGHAVTCFDVETKANLKKHAKLARSLEFDTVWGDLCQAQGVGQLVEQAQPDAIIHLAAVIPPFAYVNPELAYDVNANGTRHLVEAAQALDRAPRFVYISSYSVHGPRNPHRDLPLLTGDTPVNPGDNYARHKVACEALVQESSLSWTILRLCGVMPLGDSQMNQPAMMRYLFLMPLERRQHGIDARDAGLAVANAVTADVEERILDIGGGEGWQWRAGDFFAEMLEVMGIGALPDSAFRQCDPAVDESWYYEDWVDTTESESLLRYQRHSPADYMDALKRQAGFQRALARILAPFARRQLLGYSLYYGHLGQPDPRTHWQVARDVFGMDPDTE